MPECKDNKCLADTFADYFIEKIQKIQEALDNQPLYTPTNQEAPTRRIYTIYRREYRKDNWKYATKML